MNNLALFWLQVSDREWKARSNDTEFRIRSAVIHDPDYLGKLLFNYPYYSLSKVLFYVSRKKRITARLGSAHSLRAAKRLAVQGRA